MRFATALLLGIGFASSALAQTPAADAIKGKWMAKTSGCGDTTMTIRSVAANGVVDGTIECPKMKAVVQIGEKLITGKQMAGKFDGTNLNIEGTSSYTHVKLQDGKLVGQASAGPSAPRTDVTYVRQ